MKRKLLIPALLLIFVATAAAFVFYYNRLDPAYIHKVLLDEYAETSVIVKKEIPDDCSLTTFQANKKCKSSWKKVETEMLKTGVSHQEVQGVLASAHNHFSHPEKEMIFGIPMRVKHIRIHFRSIWVIGFGWGYGSENPKISLDELPNHIRVIAIDSRKPYKELGMETCL